MKKPDNNSLETKVLKDIQDQVCKSNFDYWKAKYDGIKIDSKELKKVQESIDGIFPAHTFPYEKDGNMILKMIFGYDEKSATFNPRSEGILAKKFRDGSAPKFGHMGTSDKLGHDKFIFAYLGVHNPYHRENDDFPIRPFGVFVKKEVEVFAYCHGTPADVAEENELIDRSNLDKYYLLPKDLRELKAIEILSDSEIKDFDFYMGKPDYWDEDYDYSDNLYKKTGEMRYYHSISANDIEAILWPFFKGDFYNAVVDIDENLDLYNAFKKAFPNIHVIKYSHDDANQTDWDMRLVESSYYTYLFYMKNGSFPFDSKFAIDALKK